MDKETLSHYGWIVIVSLVLAIMIALATPFGKFVGQAVSNTVRGFAGTAQTKFDGSDFDADQFELDYNKDKQEWEDAKNGIVKREAGSVIPDGAIYTKADGTTLVGNGANVFPDTPATNDTYEEGDYAYKYNQYYYDSSWESDTSQNGWGVRVKDDTKTTYGVIISEIAGQPATNMTYTFYNCTSLTTAPAIPNSVTEVYCTFSNCTSLTTAPTIPNSVTRLSSTFYGCISLTTAPTIPSSVTHMRYTFKDCTSLTTAPTIPNSVTYMVGTFQNCTSLITAPEIPSSVTDIGTTFGNCTSLTTAPTIPSSVTSMSGTFQNCTSLTGTIEINANPTDCYFCFMGTVKPITLTGSSTKLTEFATTSTSGNVTVK